MDRDGFTDLIALSPEQAVLLEELMEREGIVSEEPKSTIRRLGRKKAPLSFAQQGLWLVEQLQPASPLYNLPLAIRLTGRLDEASLKKALNAVVARHESLRTIFTVEKKEPIQEVLESAEWAMRGAEREALLQHPSPSEINSALEQLSRRPFDLSRGPLFRAHLLRQSEDEHVLLLVMHHVVSDAWSLDLIFHELAVLYERFASRQDREERSAGPSSPRSGSERRLPARLGGASIPSGPSWRPALLVAESVRADRIGNPALENPPTIQYADYAAWQRQRLQSGSLKEQVAYWKHQLADPPASLSWPSDWPASAEAGWDGAIQSVVWPRSLSDQIREISEREDVTAFMLLLAAYQILLHRCCGQNDILVGTPLSNRTETELEGVVGLFVNTVVLRSVFSAGLTFRQLLDHVREEVLGASAHQDLSFERVVEELQPDRTSTRHPLFQTMFSFERSSRKARRAADLIMTPMDLHTGVAKFDLSFQIVEREQGMIVMAEYNTGLFSANTIARWLGHYQTLVQSIVANPTARITSLALLSEMERRYVLRELNATDLEYAQKKCLHELFEEQAERTPNAVAAVSPKCRWTYCELDAAADRVALRLRQMGVGPEVLVAVCMQRSLEMLAALLGVLKAGGAYVPLDPAYPPERLAFALSDSQARVVLADTIVLPRLPPHSACVISLDALWEELAGTEKNTSSERADACAPTSSPQPETLAYVIYTSGSTGRPKGVCVEHRNALALVAWARDTYSPEELKGVLASTSVCFDLSVFEVFVPLSCGGKVILADNLLQLPELTAAGEVTLINTVPSAMAELLRLGSVPESVRAINLAGEPLSQQLVREICQSTRARRVFDLYGPTEDTVYSTAAQRQPDGIATIGRPLSNKQVYLLDAHLQPVPFGIPGELCISGDGLARGYLGRPDLTAEKFAPHPFDRSPGARLYHTGDRARFLADGNIEFLGRKDHQVKLRGFRIELGEIETALRQHPSVRECLVMLRELSPEEKALIGYVVSMEDAFADAGALRRFLAEKLPGYMVPSNFVFLEDMPRTPNGKVNRQALPSPHPAPGQVDESHHSPRTPTEQTLADIWSAVLGRETIRVEENFFELGGHSLLVSRVTARVRDVFGIEVPMRFLFEAPTIGALAPMIDKMLADDAVRNPDCPL